MMSTGTDARIGRIKCWAQSKHAALTQFSEELDAKCSINEEEKHKQQAQISNLKRKNAVLYNHFCNN